MDEEQETREPKIHLPVAILVGLAVLVLDLIDLIPIAGDITDIPSLMVNFYLLTIGVSGIVFLIGEVLDLIPVVQEFPCRSIAWWVTVGIDHFAPASVQQVFERVGEELQGGEGALEGEAVAGGVGAAEGAGGAVATAEGGTALVEEGGSVEFGAEEGGEAEEPSEEGRPSDRIETKDRKATDQREREEGQNEEEGSAEEGGKEGQGVDEFASGSEITPEEEAEEAAFSPEALEFKEGRFGRDDDEDDLGEGSTGGESEAEKTARKQQAKVIDIRDRFEKPKGARPLGQDQDQKQDGNNDKQLPKAA